MICDLCQIPISPDAEQFHPTQMRIAVRAGLRPPEQMYQLAEAMGNPRRQWEASWLQIVKNESNPWAVCSQCAAQTHRFLPSARKWWQFWKR